MYRREFARSAAGLGLFSLADWGTVGAVDSGNHPGPPRFLTVGEAIDDERWQGSSSEPVQRDDLAPRVGDPTSAHGNYATAPAEDRFSWSVTAKPAGSSATLDLGTDDDWGDVDNVDDVVGFEPDVPGEYRLELSVDGGATTYEQVVRIFPTPSDGGNPPRIHVDGEYDASADEYVLRATPRAAPVESTADADLPVEIYRDDRTSGPGSQQRVASGTGEVAHTVAGSSVSGTTRFHAVAYHTSDGRSSADTVHLSNRAVERWNESPGWIRDTTVYEIFVRSFAGDDATKTTFPYLESKVPYLADLGVGAVWLTPVLEATSTDPGYGAGSHHGYDVENYFDVAADLGTEADFESFVATCHDHDIEVIFDLVINHVSKYHELWQHGASPGDQYGDWFKRDPDGTADVYWGWDVLKVLNYGNMAVREHVLSVVEKWAGVVDGFRCDIAFGVPHGFWKEVRDRVKAQDADFVLLDETIPYDRAYSEGEFDFHFGSNLYYLLRRIVEGTADPRDLLHVVDARLDNGVRRETPFLQYLTNHDEARFLDFGTPAQERAAAAATFTLPGTPMIYYGQEILLDGSGEYDDEAREPMQWSDLSDDQRAHRSFYRRLVALRSGPDAKPALQSTADFVEVEYASDSDDVVAFSRESDSDTAVVVLHFGSGSATVELDGRVAATDLVSGERVGSRSDGTTAVTVDDAVVLDAAPRLGERVAVWADPVGDDHGPGSYTYPQHFWFYEGAFDLSAFEIRETTDRYQFYFALDGEIQNSRDWPRGFSMQLPELYLRDPSATELPESETARTGVNATLAAPYHYRLANIEGTDEVQPKLLTADGSVVTDDVTVQGSTYHDGILVDVPKEALGSLAEMAVCPLMLSEDDSAGHRTRAVVSTETWESCWQNDWRFGGGRDDAQDTNVIDIVTDRGTDQSSALAATDQQQATLPYLSVQRGMRHAAAGGTLLAEWDDPGGEGLGPGEYTMPTDDAFYEGAFDLTSVAVYETASRYKFVFSLAAGFENPYYGDGGFSHPYPHVYLHDPQGSGGSTASSGDRNVGFQQPFHYRVSATGNGEDVVVDADGTVLTRDVTATAHESFTGVVVDVPKAPIGDVTRMDAAFLLCAQMEGGIRWVQNGTGQYLFGGGTDSGNDPHVLDLVTPDGVSQAEALAYDETSRARVPFVPVDPGRQ